MSGEPKTSVITNIPFEIRPVDLSFATKITDAGLKELTKLQQLTWLLLYDCNKITDEAVAEMRKALPNCKIDH